MNYPTRIRRLAAAAVLFSVFPVHAAPVAVNDTYSVSEDTLLATGGGSLVSANFESPGNVIAGTWSYLDKIKNNQNGQTPDTYPLDNASRAWNSLLFNTATSTVGPWGTADMPIQGGGIDGFAGAPNTLTGYSATNGAPYSVTTYLFRKSFTLDAASAAITQWTLTHLVDDSAIFYVNGQEIGRVRLDPATNYTPAGPLTTNTSTSTNIPSESAYTTDGITVPPGLLVTGTNVFAVELHQGGGSTYSSGDAGIDVQFSPAAAALTGGFTYADNTFGTTAPDAFATGVLLNTVGNPGGSLNVSLQRPSSPSQNISGGWSRTITMANAGTLRVQVDARVRLLGGFESTEYGQAVLSVDGTRYGPVSNARGVSLVETFGQDGVTEIPGPWQSLTVDVPGVPAGSHTVILGAFTNRPTDTTENCQVYFDNLTLSVVGTGNSVLANDTGGAVTAQLVATTTHGTLNLLSDGNFNYTPAANYAGPDSFTYRALDAGAAQSNVGTVSITVNAVNDPPVAVTDNYATNQQQTLTVNAAGGVLANDTDVDNSAAQLSAVLVTAPQVSQGTVTLNANGSFTFVPAPAFTGPAAFVYRTTDGSANSGDATVNITVNNVGAAPVANNDTYTTAINTPLVVTALVPSSTPDDLIPFGSTAVSSIWRYLDDGSDQGTAWRGTTFVDTAWKTGGSELGYGNSDEVTVVEDNATPGYVNPASDRYATTYFRRQFTVNRTWEISALDLSLVFDDGAVIYLGGTEAFRTTTMSGAGTDPAYDYYTGTSSQNNDTANQTLPVSSLDEGLNTIAAEVHQTSATSSDISFNLRLRATRSVPAGVLANDTDADAGTTLTVSTNTNPSHGTVTVNANGTFTYTPAIGYVGPDSFTYRCTDGLLSSVVATVNLTVVIGPNVRPAVTADTYAATEETTLNVSAASGVLANDFDADGDAFTAVLVTPPASGTLTLNANGSFSYTPTLNVTGPVTFTYSANDLGGPSAPATATINIANVNDAPVAVNETYSTDPGVAVTVPAPGVLGNDTDADPGFALTAAVVTPPAQGVLTLNPNGSFNYAPPVGFTGNATFTYRANDGTVNSNNATVTIRINGRPVANANSYAATEDTPLNIAAAGVLSNDTDPENDPLTAQLTTNVTHGTLGLGSNGGFTYTPAPNYNGSDSFTYKAFDGARDSLAAATVTINIAAVNDAPVAVADSYATPLSTPLNVPVATGLLGNDSDVDGQSITAVINTSPAHGIVGLNPDGSFLYTPNGGFSGLDSFTYRASDGVLSSAVTTVNIGVGIDLTKVFINEIHYHPLSLSAGDEFIEIFNANPGNLDVTGWQLTAGVSYTLPGGTVIPAGGYLVIAANPTQFTATFAGVPLLRGPWTGELSNSGETIRLKTAAGETVDEVTYADEGDWALRYQASIGGQTGWEWYTRADAGGSSLELISHTLTNASGQAWTWSTAAPTPGAVNSVNDDDIAPLMTDLDHRPEVPRSTDPVTVTVNVTDESLTPPAVALFWRLSIASPASFTQAPMFDDGVHGDGAAGDGEFGAVIPPQANGSVVEFYVSATDGANNTRTWPSPGLDLAQTQLIQACNAFYQVDEEVWANHYPIYRLVGSAEDVSLYLGAWNRGSDAQLNITFVEKQGADIAVRYRCGLRVRGAGSRGNSINNWRLNIPKDDPWRNETEANLNVWHTHLGDLGSKLMETAGLIHERSWPVQVRLNTTNNALNNSQFSNGYFIHLLPSGGEYLNELRPNDSGGNIYKKVRPHQDLTVHEQSAGGPPNPSGYISDGWNKSTNEDLNDWTDLHNLIKTFRNGTPTLAQMEAVMNVDYWLRWQAFQVIINHNETNLSNGSNDDYGLYRGIVDPRFIPLAHDFDTILGDGGNTSGLDPTSPTSTIYQLNGNFSNGETLPSLQPIMANPVMNQRFKAQLVDLLNTVFLPANFNPFVDSVLGDWTGPTAAYGVSLSKRDAIKSFMAARRTHILQTVLGYSAGGVPPAAVTATTSLPVVSGYPQTTTANSTGLGGTVDSTRVQKVRVNGTDILPNNYNDAGNGASGDGEGGNGVSPWTAGTAVVLQPGINHLVIQALGPNDAVIAATALDLWYDDGGSVTKSGTLAASETWSAAGGPWQVTANLTVPSGVTLTIDPGATVFVAAGATIQAAGTGRILAEGNANSHIRFTGVPGSGNWGALDILNATVESRFVYCDFEMMAGTTVSGQAAMSHINNAIVLFDHTTWSNTPAQRYLSFDNSSFIVSNSTFPTYAGTFNTTTGPEMIQGLNGIPAAGYGVFRDNYFGHTWGANDTIEFTGGNRPAAILQVINNVFDGGTDECLELDSTDAWIEGNTFMHVHQDTQRASALDTANAIGGGQDSAAVGEWTILNNLFYDVDHAVLARNRNRFIFINNTLAHVAKEAGAGVDIAAFNFSDSSAPLALLADGQGGYVSGNVIHDTVNLVPAAAASYNPANVTLQMVRNLFPSGVLWTGPGSNNLSAPALLTTSLLPAPGVPVAGTVSSGLAQAAQIRAAFVPQQVSPAVCAGLLSRNLGALHAAGIEIAGEPPVDTSSTTAILTVGPGGSFTAGSAPAYAWGYVSYRYSLDGGPYSAETPVSIPLSLTGLAPGTHSVSVLGKTDGGVWQTAPTVSKTWTVNAGARPVVISEVLANNVNAWPVGAARPDYIELRNLSGAAVDIGGWAISDDTVTAFTPPKYTFSPGTLVPAGGYLLLNTDTLGFSLNSDGDEVFLYSGAAFGAPLVDSIHFGFQIADKSLSRVCDDLHWALSEPTPGAANVITETALPAGLRINEWLGTNDIIVANDFLELYNTAALPVDLSGLSLTDDAINFPALNIIAPYSFIGANGFVRFVADGNTSQGTNHLNFSIAKLREGLSLLSGATIIDHVMSSPLVEDVSQGRVTDGAPGITFFTLPTPGFSNSTVLTAQELLLDNLRITEVMYNPPGPSSAPEYIELRNLSTTQTLNLSGVAFVNGITFPFAPGTTLAPNAFIVITSATQAAFNAAYPGAPYGGTYTGKLDNGGERVRMEIAGYQLGILDFTYSDGWYPSTDGTGGALEIVNPFSPRTAWDEKVSWRGTAPNPGFNGIFGVLAGADAVVCPPAALTLEAEVTFGSQTPAGVTLQWTKISGPGTVTFGTPNADTTTAAFSAFGTYVLRLTATGTVSVFDEVTVTAAETYSAWAQRTLGTADPLIAGALRDPDKDGSNNLLEFALGLNPSQASQAGLPVGSSVGGQLRLTYQRYTACDVTYIVEASDNLLSWSSSGITESMTSSTGTLQTWVAVDGSLGSKRYMRLRVTAP